MNKITEARITKQPRPMPAGIGDPMPVVYATVAGVEQRLFDYYPDEISFTAAEFIGLTVSEAHQLKGEKDVRYLQS